METTTRKQKAANLTAEQDHICRMTICEKSLIQHWDTTDSVYTDNGHTQTYIHVFSVGRLIVVVAAADMTGLAGVVITIKKKEMKNVPECVRTHATAKSDTSNTTPNVKH